MILVSSCSCLCPTHWSQVSSREWRCSWSSADRRCSNYIWVINNSIAYEGAPYIRDLTVSQYMIVPVPQQTANRVHSSSGVVFDVRVNSLWPSDAKWRHRSGSTLAQVMTWCQTAPSHYLNQYWLEIFCIHPSAISQKMRNICWQQSSYEINILNIFMLLLGGNELTRMGLWDLLAMLISIAHTTFALFYLCDKYFLASGDLVTTPNWFTTSDLATWFFVQSIALYFTSSATGHW